ncbi:MAG: DUF4132 domain-containing protein, partial [Myxococcales bacterium]|nr:DUF4132 domain-containing protein [Myxococcales bacterium]
HLAQRLIWVDGKTGPTFRVAEDHRLATVDDETYALEGGVRLLHPATAEPGVTDAWALVLADYELIQPFSQLQRPVHAFTEAERASGVFRRLDGKEAPLAKVLALRDRGWAPGEFDREHGSGYHDLVRGLPAGRGSLQLHLGAGIAPGVSGYRKTIPLKHVTLTFPAALDRITESELVAELLGLLDD